MTEYSEIPFQKLIDALLDIENHLHPRYLYRLSDLEPNEVDKLNETWHRVPLWRRQALMKDLEQLGSTNHLLSFEAIGRYAIRDEDPQIRKMAVQILGVFETKDLVPLFLKLIETDSDIEVRASAASALGRFVYLGEVDKIPDQAQREIEDRLLQLVDSEEVAEVRRCALESLSYSGRPEIPGLIEAAYKSAQKGWMETALIAMGRSIDERWQHHILEMLDSRYPSLREEAARAAGELELSEAVSRLLELLDDSNEDVRKATIWSLSQIGGEGVREAIEELLQRADLVEEIDLLEAALDNLSFTEDFQLYSLFDFGGIDIEEDLLESLEDEREFSGHDIDEDGEEMQD